jgi:hypothetical protein
VAQIAQGLLLPASFFAHAFERVYLPQMDHYLITLDTLDKFDRAGSFYPKEWRK